MEAIPQAVQAKVRDPELVEKRRRQIVDAAVALFAEKGFHRTTTRELARAVGFSIGLLYEYVSSKEDVLYLVCEDIHREMERAVAEALGQSGGGREAVAGMIREYFSVCGRMEKHILLIYRETHALGEAHRKRVLESEVRITRLFVDALTGLVNGGRLSPMGPGALELLAHDITVMGHMWAFRGWFLQRRYGLEEYVKLQTSLILDRLAGPGDRKDP
ncbi:MAG: TetR/AcrR family transcriptional regulator [Proteobacteria bacterium]|nr:TetR/AcrR family transcriptional regulator [Pseudomonadota bacterium]